jgi:chemotaxis response regulator CheB
MRIGIVNDTPFAVEALKRALLARPQYQVAWVARDGAQAVDLCAQDTPDLVLMDLLMPVLDGVEATKRIMARSPCAILIVTYSIGTNAARVFEAMGHGALDAVNTPALGLGGASEPAAQFLNKIAVIGKLIRDRTGVAAQVPNLARTIPPVRRDRPPLIAIGASAGGPNALATLLHGLPTDLGAALVVVQHVDAEFAAGMADWLNQRSSLPVRLAREGDRPQGGQVLLAGSDDHLVFKTSEMLGYTPEPRDNAYRPSVDVFFDSVCHDWRGDVIGVLLTGMGRDGALGLKNLRTRRHHTIAQDQATCAVYGMPKAAAQLDAAVDILPIQKIARRLAELLGRPMK